jgi:sugar (pentulose or hexulose) kinase
VAGRANVVLDIGKTHSKLSLWGADGRLVERHARANPVRHGARYRELDIEGVEAWLAEILARFAGLAPIGAIVPVGHGAAAVLIHEGRVFAPPMDYEDDPAAAEREAYAAERDPFGQTGSPQLPFGLNLGLQLHRLEALTGPWPSDLQIVTWPQYWAWRLSGRATCEVSSLGCHTDLWLPFEGRPSPLAVRRGWAARLAPLASAGAALGPVTAEWRERCGLPEDCAVYCGLHDSNSALNAALGHAELAGGDMTVLSTGTWFVAMRRPSSAADTAGLSAERDCLVNVDVAGRPVPSARFMGGRETEVLCGASLGAAPSDAGGLAARAAALVAAGAMIRPTATPGVGPFPHGQGGWIGAIEGDEARRAAVSLYLALTSDAMLDLIGSRERLLVEGRFADDQLFVAALARLRPEQQVYASNAQDDVCYGALRLLDPGLPSPGGLVRIEPLALDLDAYRAAWRTTTSSTAGGGKAEAM